MKVKTLIITAILALSMVAGTTGCAGSTETASGIATTASTTEESTTQAETVNAGETSFDYDEVCKNIVINGKQYTFPFSVEELGEGYSIGDISYSKLDNEDEYYSVDAKLIYNNSDIASIWYFGITEEEKETNSIDFDNKKIDLLHQYAMLNEINGSYIEIMGLKIDDKSSNILEILGMPQEEKKNSSGEIGSYTYYSKEDREHSISFNYKNNLVTFISLGNKYNY